MDNIHSKWRSTNGWQTVDFKTRQNFGEAQLVALRCLSHNPRSRLVHILAAFLFEWEFHFLGRTAAVAGE
jgi:hypothetical protein